MSNPLCRMSRANEELMHTVSELQGGIDIFCCGTYLSYLQIAKNWYYPSGFPEDA